MAIAEIRDIEKAYQGRPVLKGITFDLQKGEKIGLVGPNGAGKTTLLKILAGVEQPDHGSVTIAKSVKWTYVSQVARLDPDETLRHQVTLVFDELHETERLMHEAADKLAKTTGPEHDKLMERYGDLEHHFQTMGGYDIERRVESVLDQLGFATRDLDLPIKALSGGQKSRAQIARLLLEGPDLMFLDEPTNHLDLPMLDWLEETLNEMIDTTLVVVSHDRYFLDSVVNEIYELQGGRVEHYPGNYSAFTELKVERNLSQQRSYEQQQAYIAKQEEYIRRFSAGQRAVQAKGRKKRLDRLKAGGGEQGLIQTATLVNAVRRDGRKVVLNLKVKKTSGHDVLKLEGLTKAFPDKKLFDNLDLVLSRGKRLGIIGPNGSGKTTLLNTIFGEVPPEAGEITWGYGVVKQFYRQEHQDLNADNNILQELQTARITATQQELRDLAGLFLFSGETQEKKIGVLSGGEKSRVALSKLLLNPTNTILMDEPTNHLDMATAEVLEEALDSYDGTLILVSHDRYFMDQVCDQLLVLQPAHLANTAEKPSWKLYNGSYSDYLAAVAQEKAAIIEGKRLAEKLEKQKEQDRQQAEKARQKSANQKNAKPAGPKPNPMKFVKLTVQQIEEKITAVESQLANLEGSFANPNVAANPQALRDLKQKYEVGRKELADLNAAWEMKIKNAKN